MLPQALTSCRSCVGETRGDDRWSKNWHDLSRYETPETRWNAAGLDPRSRSAALSLYAEDAAPAWWQVYHQVGAMLFHGMLVGLVGRFGTGKTVMAARLIRDVCEAGENGQYTTAPKVFRALQSTFRDEGESEQAIINRLIQPALLVIDEAHERAHTDYEDRRLREIIDARYGRQRDTLLITNMSAQEFAASIGGAAVDRMRQCGGIIECNWSSFRATKPEASHA